MRNVNICGFIVFCFLFFFGFSSYSSGLFQPEVSNNPDTLKIERELSHFWDDFNFSDQTVYKSKGLLVGLKYYLDMVCSLPEDKGWNRIAYFLKKSETVGFANRFFCDKLKDAFYSPNSVYRNDKWAGRLLEYRLNSPNYSREEKASDRDLLAFISRNRKGNPAENFSIKLKGGQPTDLYSLGADYILIYFFNPECDKCKSVSQKLYDEPMRTYFKNINVKILAVCVDCHSDFDLPEQAKNDYVIVPADIDVRVKSQNLYDNRAIPSLYLLDENKTVLCRDASVEEIIQFFREQRK